MGYGKLCNRVGRPPTAPGYRLLFQQMNPSLLVVVMMQVFLDILFSLLFEMDGRMKTKEESGIEFLENRGEWKQELEELSRRRWKGDEEGKE